MEDIINSAIASIGKSDQYRVDAISKVNFIIADPETMNSFKNSSIFGKMSIDIQKLPPPNEEVGVSWLQSACFVEFEDGVANVAGNVLMTINLAQPDSIEQIGLAIKNSMDKYGDNSWVTATTD